MQYALQLSDRLECLKHEKLSQTKGRIEKIRHEGGQYEKYEQRR